MRRRRRRPLLWVALLFVGLPLATTPAIADKPAAKPDGLPAAQVAAIGTQAEAYTDSELLVGVVIAVVDGKREAVLGYGRTDVDRDEKPNGTTVFEIGSIGKALTGVLLAHDVLAGRLALETPVQDLLPKDTKLATKGDRPMTVLDVATHRSGLPRMPDNFRPKDPFNPYADYTTDQLYAFLRSWEPARAPGERYAYSNLGFGLLGQMLARKASTTYEALVLERLAKPLGLTDTRVVYTPAMKPRVARPHKLDTSPTKTWDLPTFAGAGGVRSTANDMLRILKSALRPDATPLGKAQALAQKRHERRPGGPPMGLGWHIDGAGRHWHNGETGGYHAFMAFDRAKDRGVVVLSNTGTGLVDKLGRNVLAILDGKTPDLPAVPKVVDVPLEAMDALEGTYTLGPGRVFTVERVGRRLAVTLTGQPTWRVFPVSETKWTYRITPASLTFARDEEGKVTGLVLFQHGQRTPAPKTD
ncbi:MAG: serine hydrolase [Planctomycetota bacterium]|nr:serine hydrolase [Planctomycetota bacterium]